MSASTRTLVGAGLLTVMPFIAVARMDDPLRSYPALLALLFSATLGWALAWRCLACGPRRGRGHLLAVLLVGALLRFLVCLPSQPLSDDLFRYLWDGRVANSGENPFAYAPTDEALVELRDAAIWPQINHPEIPTIYPPTAQLFFRALNAVDATPHAVRAIVSVFDLLVALVLAALLQQRGKPPALAVVYAWCPLAVLESAGGGHVDILGLLLLLSAFFWWGRSRAGVAGVAAVLSFLVKPVAAVAFFPALFSSRATTRSRVLFLAAAAIVGALLTVPYAAVGERLFTGFMTYARNWQFNDALFSLLISSGVRPTVARGVLLLALAAVLLLLARRVGDPLCGGGLSVFALLALSPTVHPWYGVWLVPFLPFLTQAFRRSAAVWVALLPVSYAASWLERTTGAWHEPTWSRIVVWGVPALLLLILSLTRAPASALQDGDR